MFGHNLIFHQVLPSPQKRYKNSPGITLGCLYSILTSFLLPNERLTDQVLNRVRLAADLLSNQRQCSQGTYRGQFGKRNQ